MCHKLQFAIATEQIARGRKIRERIHMYLPDFLLYAILDGILFKNVKELYTDWGKAEVCFVSTSLTEKWALGWREGLNFGRAGSARSNLENDFLRAGRTELTGWWDKFRFLSCFFTTSHWRRDIIAGCLQSPNKMWSAHLLDWLDWNDAKREYLVSLIGPCNVSRKILGTEYLTLSIHGLLWAWTTFPWILGRVVRLVVAGHKIFSRHRPSRCSTLLLFPGK